MSTIKGNYREFKLDNGLFVALQETPTKTVSGRLRVWHGSLNEREGEEGLAHFLEHTLMTGGSQKYDPEQANRIRGEFGSLNACTGLQKTFFPGDMLAEDAQLFLEYVSDNAFNPRFDKAKIEEERQRVLREIADEKGVPTFKDNRIYNEAFFGRGSPHIYFILGNESVVASASIEDLSGFHARGYHPNNMDLVLVGALPKNIEELIELNFGQYKPGECKRVELPKNPQLDKTTVFHVRAPELLNREHPEQSNAKLSISFVAPTETDEDFYAMKVLFNILGKDEHSRLFTSVSQMRGLAYKIGAGYIQTNNVGTIYIHGSVHSLRADEAIDAIFEEMRKLQIESVPENDLERIKKNVRYNIAKTFETNDGHIDAIEMRVYNNLTPEVYLEKIGEVTPEKIMEAARKYLPQSRADGKYVLMLRDPLKVE